MAVCAPYFPMEVAGRLNMTLGLVSPPSSSIHSVLIKCFADEEALQHVERDSRKPFKELKVNFGDDDGTAKPPRSDAGPDSPSSSYDDLELSDSERDVLVPVVDQLIRGISSDFLFDCDGPCYLDSLIGCSGQGGMAGSAGGAGQHAQSRMAEPPAKAALPREQTDAGKDHLIKAAPAGQPAAPTVGRINLAAMISEKSALKRELRSLDVEFEQREGRKPTKQEKEHLRPLYVRYWKLKHQISKLHAMGAGK